MKVSVIGSTTGGAGAQVSEMSEYNIFDFVGKNNGQRSGDKLLRQDTAGRVRTSKGRKRLTDHHRIGRAPVG